MLAGQLTMQRFRTLSGSGPGVRTSFFLFFILVFSHAGSAPGNQAPVTGLRIELWVLLSGGDG